MKPLQKLPKGARQTARRTLRFLIQFELDELAAFLDAAVSDPDVAYNDVAEAAQRQATLIMHLKLLHDPEASFGPMAMLPNLRGEA